MWRRLPHPALRHSIIDLVGYHEGARGHFRQVEGASLLVPLVISFGEPFEIALGRIPRMTDRHANFVGGLFGGPVVIDSFGACSCIQVNFTPLGARRFFRSPMHEFANKLVGVDDVLGQEAVRLRDRLGEERNWHRRFDVIEDYLRARLLSAPVPSSPVAFAYGKIVESRGTGSVAALAARLSWSRKHLAARFREEVGLTPKAVARIARFNFAMSLSASGHTWADVAAESGYADQAHLVHEFAELAGETPTAWKIRTA